MSTKRSVIFGVSMLILALAVPVNAAEPTVGTAFTYQGRLTQVGSPVTGSYDLKFSLYNALTGGSIIGSAVTQSSVAVSGGVFSVTLDFGSTAFTGGARWLEIAVKPAGGASYTTLSPRQALNPTPYALSVPWSGISGSKLSGTGSATSAARSDHNHWGANWCGRDFGLILQTTATTYSNPVAITGITRAPSGNAILGTVTETGTYGYMLKQTGVAGLNNGTQEGGYGVYGSAGAANSFGVFGRTFGSASTGATGQSDGTNGIGVAGTATQTGGIGVKATGKSYGVYSLAEAIGVRGSATASNGFGVYGVANNGSGAVGVYAISTSGYAGYFNGKVHVVGALSKSSGSFLIDHPLDPARKYLSHSFVESPDMMNIYNGNAILDANGEAVVTLPDWFEALNKDFRYQLTCIGGFSPVYVADEIAKNKFRIAGGREGLKVSWQVTGVRKDAWANNNRIQVETAKPADEQGTYLYPQGFGQKSTLGLDAVRGEKLKPSKP